ncbi:zinc finger homeobox protein 3-like [Polymixia lowei]
MDSGEGGGDGGGGEERDADLSPQALSLPLLTLAVIPEQGSSSHTSAAAPAKEPLTLPRWEEEEEEEEGAEGSQAREETWGGDERDGGRHLQGNGGCRKQGTEEDDGEGCLFGLEKEEGEVYAGVGEESFFTGGLPAALGGGDGEEEEEEENEEEEAISNQSQTKSKCSLLPQRSQHSSSSSTAMASGTLGSKTTTSPKPSPAPSASPKPSPFLPASPKHFTCPSSSSSAPLSETEVKDIKGERGWISGFPQSFKSRQPAPAFPLADTESAGTPAENDGPAGVPHTSIANGDGAKAPEPNDSQTEKEADEERDKEGDPKEAVLKNLNQDLSPGSLTSHMTIMHSRNSCKTLKCPKCNWHYKSQHTLQVHMREKHPETGGQCVCGASGGKCVCGGATKGVCGYCSSGKPHPRLARGETYACGYKPYRCEVCDYATSSKGNLSIHMQSDKHLNNVQNGGHSNGHTHTPSAAHGHGGGGGSANGHAVDEQAYKLALPVHAPAAQPAKLAPPAQSHPHGKRWRCDVCDYETSIARNLRIHTTSEKHTHNMLRLQRGYYLSHCRSLTPQLKHLQNAGGELPLNIHLTGQQAPDPSVTLGSTLTPSPSPSPSPPPAPSLSPNGPLSLGVFQCLVCSVFSSDSLESVEQHLNAPRSLPQSEWCSLVAGGCHCRLCGYTTPLRANFSLHCQTDRHRTRYQLAAHVQEGGDRGQEGAALIAKGNPVQLRCNLCDYVTISLEKLRGHSLNSHHEASVRVYRFLQQYEGEVGRGSWLFHCLLCNHSSSSKVQLLKHSQTPTHQQREGLLQLQPMGGEELAAIFTIRKSPDSVTGELSEDIETSSETTTSPLDQTKDTCNSGVEHISKETEETSGEEEEKRNSTPPVKRPSSACEEPENPPSPKRPRTHQQNENQQTVQCPLCQVTLPRAHLRQHLTYLHSVAQDCVDKLISAVTPSVEPPEPHLETEQHAKTESTDNSHMNKMNTNGSNTADSLTAVESPKNKGLSVENTEGEEATPKDVTALLTPPLEDTTSHPANGRAAPQSPTQLPPSSPPTSPPSDPPPPSDRHGYRFRCSRCSLAFPTQEKLQLHWQYHAMRAATECPLCSRRCRSQEALQRHMQNTHSQLDNTNTQNALFPPHTVQTHLGQSLSSVQQDISLSPQVGQEAGEGEDEEMEEEALGIEGKDEEREEEKIEEKDTAAEVDGGEEDLLEMERGQPEETGSEPIPSLHVKKSTNPTMDRFLDPSRPYKCTICSESFTQKTILLVHYNSVSHLHRARRALQDSGQGLANTEAPRGPDPRPYRCRLCGVGYSQSSTLDIHLRSVLHQTRARAAQNPAPQTPASSSAAPAIISTTSAQAATTREETSKSLPLAKRPDLVSPSTSSLVGLSSVAEAQLALPSQADSQQAKKRVAELLASRNQIMLMQQQQLAQAQAQAQAQLQQHTALLQSQLFNPALLQHLPLGPESLLKQHFPLVPDNLLSLQQQLLLPFYLSGEMKFNPELSLKSPELSQSDFVGSTLTAQFKREPMTESPPLKEEEQTQRENPNSAVTQQSDRVQCEAKVETGCSGFSMNQTEREYCTSSLEEKKKETTVKIEKQRQETSQANCASLNHLESECPPPRVPYAAVNGGPLRALLQSYGYELALQYIQSRQRHQLKIATQTAPEGQDGSGIKDIEVCLEKMRDELRELKDSKVEGCKEENGQRDARNGEDCLLWEKKENREEVSPNGEKACCGEGEKCRDCGKLFSDALVLKSHREYIHRLLFPTAVLERFSREYRLQYDRLYPLTHPPSEGAPAAAPTPEPEPAPEPVKPTPAPSVSDPAVEMSASTTDLKPAAPALSPPPSPSQPQVSPQQEGPTTSTAASATSQTTSQAKTIPLSLPKLPMLPLSLPQLPLPPLPLPKLPLPTIPFSMELPLLPSVVMQSVALQSQPWLDSGMTPDLAKLYQSQLSPALLGQQPQLSPALLGQQPQLSPALLGQQPQLSPALLGQPPQLNPGLLGQPSQPSPTLQQPQGSPALLEQQQSKRARTRISEDQLNVLRQHFDINSLPSDDEVNKMSALCGLPHKVIKHWFRNTLFKERQRDKDSPYNFNNPPTTALDEPREETAQTLSLTDPPSSLSPGLPANYSPQPQRADPQRGEPHRGRRSSRTRFTEQQLETLQAVFEATPYPREEEYDRLSALLSLPNRVIVVWFQNARQRARKNQDRGTEDGVEGKTQVDSVQRQRGGCYKNDDDNEDEDCGDEGQGDRQNENSMDLTYEYYTHPDSPVPVDSPPHRTEYGDEPVKGESDSICKKKEDDTSLAQDEKTQAPVQTQNGVPEADIQSQSKETADATQTLPSPQPQTELSPETPQPGSSSQKALATILSTSQSSPGYRNSPSSTPAIEKPAHTPLNLPPAPEPETGISRLPDTTPGLSTETKPQKPLQHQTQAQFQCSLCPMSLPSLQLWQEHQTRHLLAAQSQVQLLHPGFTDRPMPYMMLHPNHTLMASQLLSSAMSQMHPNPAHPMIPHMNSIHLKNTLSDHSSNTLTSLPQTSLSSTKQSSKVLSEISCEAPGVGREVEEEQRRDKRQRTTITPEQLEVLYQRYSLDSNPTRGVLESIARDVGLKRRVVQVWFQNTRARERKGQFRSTGPGTGFSLGLNHLRCPFCRALFKVKSALDAHIRSRHWAEAERAGYNLSMSNGSAGQMGNMAMSSLLDRAGPSISSSPIPNPGFVISHQELSLKPPMTSDCSAIDLSNPDEEEEYEEEEEEYPGDEGSSMAEQGSLSPEGEIQAQRQHHHHHQQQQRQRTQMSHFQVLQLRDFYRSHRTPNRQECEALGQELGLPHRVVQVWFQNARAKEKRARSISSDSAEREQAELTAGAGERDRA